VGTGSGGKKGEAAGVPGAARRLALAAKKILILRKKT
jgi:hypothetical protein